MVRGYAINADPDLALLADHIVLLCFSICIDLLEKTACHMIPASYLVSKAENEISREC